MLFLRSVRWRIPEGGSSASTTACGDGETGWDTEAAEDPSSPETHTNTHITHTYTHTTNSYPPGEHVLFGPVCPETAGGVLTAAESDMKSAGFGAVQPRLDDCFGFGGAFSRWRGIHSSDTTPTSHTNLQIYRNVYNQSWSVIFSFKNTKIQHYTSIKERFMIIHPNQLVFLPGYETFGCHDVRVCTKTL